ncbi:MAG: SRPBCC family protein, partial [Chloroflexota bacterium]
MPTVIDHAIAIPTRPHYVWDVIRDIPQNPTWQPNSQRVQFLTSVKQGRGTRWRNTTPDNREQVFEITAWYEGLGYEYRIVDGSPYPKNRGRIRLQEAPEGTVVQWTFSYEVDGFFGSIRNSIGMRGNADKQVVEGLRQLYGYIKDARNDEAYDPEASKAFLREAPNVVE